MIAETWLGRNLNHRPTVNAVCIEYQSRFLTGVLGLVLLLKMSTESFEAAKRGPRYPPEHSCHIAATVVNPQNDVGARLLSVLPAMT